MHLLAKTCVKRATWKDGKLCCPCGRELAFQYIIDGENKTFVFPIFKKFTHKIVSRRKVNTISNNDIEWDLLLHDIKQWHSDFPALEEERCDEGN